MKLLFDENLSPKLPNRLSDFFPNSIHVRDVGMEETTDPVVWDYAKDNDLMIVSKDIERAEIPKLIFDISASQVNSTLKAQIYSLYDGN